MDFRMQDRMELKALVDCSKARGAFPLGQDGLRAEPHSCTV